MPSFREDAASASDGRIVRQQFPLTLAWAVTHWKAQGMTLKRARVRIGRNVAGQPGVAFVAGTRVGHPWHLMFDVDFPEYEAFEQAKVKEEFLHTPVRFRGDRRKSTFSPVLNGTAPETTLPRCLSPPSRASLGCALIGWRK